MWTRVWNACWSSVSSRTDFFYYHWSETELLAAMNVVDEDRYLHSSLSLPLCHAVGFFPQATLEGNQEKGESCARRVRSNPSIIDPRDSSMASPSACPREREREREREMSKENVIALYPHVFSTSFSFIHSDVMVKERKNVGRENRERATFP